MERKLGVRRSREICSCGSCFARNYDSENPFGKRVDAIYEIRVGGMVNCLCMDCMIALQDALACTIFAENGQQTVF